MKTKSFWIEIVTLAAGTACVLALLFACMGAVAAVAAEPQAAQPAQALFPALNPDFHPILDSHALNSPAPRSVTLSNEDSQTMGAYEGMVTCSRCAARHSAEFGKTAADCSRACVHAGSQFTLVEGDKTYLLDGDLTLVKSFAGQRAKIVGALSGNTITVSAVAEAS